MVARVIDKASGVVQIGVAREAGLTLPERMMAR
jgi:hypothetical protein